MTSPFGNNVAAGARQTDPRHDKGLILRIGVYAFTTLGTPVVAYLAVKGWIGDPEVALWSGLVTAVSGMAGFNALRQRLRGELP